MPVRAASPVPTPQLQTPGLSVSVRLGTNFVFKYNINNISCSVLVLAHLGPTIITQASKYPTSPAHSPSQTIGRSCCLLVGGARNIRREGGPLRKIYSPHRGQVCRAVRLCRAVRDPNPVQCSHRILASHAAAAAGFRDGRPAAVLHDVRDRRPTRRRHPGLRLRAPPLQPVPGPQHALPAALRPPHLPGVPLPGGGGRAAPVLGREPHLLHGRRLPRRRRGWGHAGAPRRRPRRRARRARQDPRQPRPQLLRLLGPPRRQHARGHRPHVRRDRERHGRRARPRRLDQQRRGRPRHRRALPGRQRAALGGRRRGRWWRSSWRRRGRQAGWEEIRPCALNPIAVLSLLLLP
jgi:hypothetical protein